MGKMNRKEVKKMTKNEVKRMSKVEMNKLRGGQKGQMPNFTSAGGKE